MSASQTPTDVVVFDNLVDKHGNKITFPSSGIQYDIVFFITRAQPFHNGHAANVKQALAVSNRVVVIVGSVGIARDTRNPFTFEERKAMILDSFPGEDRITVAPMRDYPYNDNMWASYVQKLVNEECKGENLRVALIGHKKADTEYYLSMFPQWDFISTEQVGELNATMIRKAFFQRELAFHDWNRGISANVAPAVDNALDNFAFVDNTFDQTQIMQRLVREAEFLVKHAKAWAGSPYTPLFVTVDACIVQSGHVLVVRRKSAPGEGLYALPGGYLNPLERILDAMLRELYEETKLKVPKDVLRGSIKGKEVYDFPTRSLRGRIITHAFLIQLKDGLLPKVKGADDADKAFWMPLAEFYKSQDRFFEDHWYIIEDLVNRFVK